VVWCTTGVGQKHPPEGGRSRIPRNENPVPSRKVLSPGGVDPPFLGGYPPLFGVRTPRVGGTPEKSPYAEAPGTPPDPSRGGTPPRGGSTPPFLTKIPYFIEKRRFFGSDRCYGAFFCDTIVPSKSIERFCVCWRSKNVNFDLVSQKWGT
jgi:hypothetical protein